MFVRGARFRGEGAAAIFVWGKATCHLCAALSLAQSV